MTRRRLSAAGLSSWGHVPHSLDLALLSLLKIARMTFDAALMVTVFTVPAG